MVGMSEDSKIRCGVVGTGYLGQHHARIYAALETTELVGIVEADDARADEICKLYGCERFASPAALAEACDAVSVVVPTDRHAEVAVPLLEGGCHLLIEKPLCTSLEEAEQILNAAKAAGSIVQVGHIEHYNPVMGYLENAVTAPKFITADRLAPFNPRGTEVGVVLDLMIHDLGVILALVKSPVKSVEAVGVNVLSPSEDIANARITFENGCVANINTSRVSMKKVREIRVFQPANYLSLDFMNQSGHFLRKEGFELHREEIPIEKDEPLKLELESFAQVVRETGKPKVGAELGKSALELAIQITELIHQQA
ncbi:Gfo/Idh/MocA family oxidoreductase [Coraliomargarita akajimensis]|uniref:Oxidoreductase domain protein n=1 Tax=Coraliomargarita akajimensis (strain DSM 45221 / IAM 15411 / JCM 23193 / KCTC 12865 / 04OKA010-24) TaxID=583355 RepID=D5EQ92_CORAD|nr:oxidoreductase domain protein [Coraliomargarita akajimensis DSM 45221]